jgi:hypothetical protein
LVRRKPLAADAIACWKRNLTVTDIDHRQLGRDSLFLMADLRLDGQDGEHRVRVRNLSAGGMMAEARCA